MKAREDDDGLVLRKILEELLEELGLPRIDRLDRAVVELEEARGYLLKAEEARQRVPGRDGARVEHRQEFCRKVLIVRRGLPGELERPRISTPAEDLGRRSP